MSRQTLLALLMLTPAIACEGGGQAEEGSEAGEDTTAEGTGTDDGTGTGDGPSTGTASLGETDDADSGSTTDEPETDGSTDEGSTDTGDPEPLELEPAGSTFFGGDRFERVQGVHVDAAGYIYLGGTTHSANFPATAGAFDTTKSGPAGNANQYALSDGYVAKLSPDATTVEWATFIGGSARESVYGVRTDSAGNVYAVGATGSPDFPTTAGAYDPTVNGPTGGASLGDSFVVRLSPDGSTLDFGTVVGGAAGSEENPRGSIQIDEANDRLWVSGLTSSPNFPTTPGAFQTNYAGGANDAFVFALSLDGGELLHATYLGGSGSDMGYTKVSLHPDGSVLLAGTTSSPDFPVTAGAFQTTLASGAPSDDWYQDGDVYVARFSADLGDLIFASYLGGNASDAVGHNQGAGVDSMGRIVVAGSTSSTDFPTTPGAFSDSPQGGTEGFVAVIAEDGSAIEYATYVGGSDNESLSTMFVGPDDRVYITGTINSDDWPITDDAVQPSFGNGAAGGGYTDAVLTVFDPTLSVIEYSTFLGGSGTTSGAERGRGLWVTDDGSTYVAGATDSSDFPIVAPSVQADYGGGVDGFMFRFDRL